MLSLRSIQNLTLRPGRAAILPIALLLSPALALAQGLTGQVSGTGIDSTGAAVARAPCGP